MVISPPFLNLQKNKGVFLIIKIRQIVGSKKNFKNFYLLGSWISKFHKLETHFCELLRPRAPPFQKMKWNPWNLVTTLQKSCFLGPTIFEIPQPNWYVQCTWAKFLRTSLWIRAVFQSIFLLINDNSQARFFYSALKELIHMKIMLAGQTLDQMHWLAKGPKWLAWPHYFACCLYS